MNYGKLIDGNLVLAPNPVTVDERRIGNPPAETLLALGYLPVIYTEPPIVEAGYEAVSGWYDDGEEIRQVWTVVVAPVAEDDALTRYSNALTGAEDETLTEAAETLIKQKMEE